MPNRFRKLLATAAGSLLLAVPLTLVAPTPGSAEEPVGHLPTPEDFVTQQYEDFLSRPPDAAGLAYWADLVREGVEPQAVVESMALSPEFEGTIAPLVRLYSAFFQRPPDYDGLTYWTGVVRDGQSLEAVAQEFARSAEFQATYGSLDDQAYVDLVYANVLDRPADAEGRIYWVDLLSYGLSRGAAMVAFSDSTEYRRISGPQVLSTMLYVGMLRRAPDSSGLDYWADVIGGGVPYRDVIAGFLGATEYGNRMGRIYDGVEPLTGVPTREAPTRPALAVKIDNVDRARRPVAIDRADVLYEEMVEGRLTRLIAVFHSDLPDVVGPIRSVRTTDIDVLAQLGVPLLAASGANPGVLAEVADAELVNVNALVAGNAYYRSSNRSAPHNLMARPVDLYEAAAGRGAAPGALFHYRAAGQGPVNDVATGGVEVDFGSATASYAWSGSDRGWRRTQNGSAHVTADGTRLAPANVVVLEVAYGSSAIDAESPEAQTIGSGTAFVLTAGRLVVGNWSRSTATEAIRLTDGNGGEIGLSRGQTFVELAPTGSITLR